MTIDELKGLATQLSCPSGEHGVEVANLMHQSNESMTNHAIFCLDIKEQDVVLELGHGSCQHLDTVLLQAKDVIYQGLEISKLMVAEANGNNAVAVGHQKANFALYDGTQIPFAANTFDRIMTVNTIYFWKKPHELLQQLYDVLKPQGTLVITFAHKGFMETLPFVAYGFELYDHDRIVNLINQTDFTLARWSTEKEVLQSKSGEMVEREFSSVVLKKGNR